MLGYIATESGNRSHLIVKKDINAYWKWPQNIRVNGIYLDSVKQSSLPYYQDLYRYAKDVFGKDFKVVITLDKNIKEDNLELRTLADIVVGFKGSYDTFKDSRLDYDNKKLNNNKELEFAALIHDCPSTENMNTAIKKSIESNIRFVYITNDKSTNDLKFLPKYFEDEVNTIASKKKRIIFNY